MFCLSMDTSSSFLHISPALFQSIVSPWNLLWTLHLHVKVLQVLSLASSHFTISPQWFHPQQEFQLSAVLILKILNVYSSPYLFLEFCLYIPLATIQLLHMISNSVYLKMDSTSAFSFPQFKPNPLPIYPLFWGEGCHHVFRCLLPSSTSVKTQILSTVVLKNL